MTPSDPLACRLLVDPPGGGAWNMALDDVLLDAAAQENAFTLRFYGWSAPTLSLGYFQPYSNRDLHPATLACECVRRSSGGGAILHDRELTYSVAVPGEHPLAHHPQALYDALHTSLVEGLREAGIAGLSLAEQSPTIGAEPFLCFQRRSVGDVLLGLHKVAGSAQRRRHGAVLQHGSVLLAASSAAPELPGICDLAGCSLVAHEVMDVWLPRLASPLCVRFDPGTLRDSEQRRAEDLVTTKFGQDAWTQRR